MPSLSELQSRYERFIEARDWEKYHTPKSVAMALSVETNELVEIFQWHDNVPASDYAGDNEIREAVTDELADIVIYCLSLAAQFDIDLLDAVEKKMKRNEERFSEQKAEEISKSIEEYRQ